MTQPQTTEAQLRQKARTIVTAEHGACEREDGHNICMAPTHNDSYFDDEDAACDQFEMLVAGAVTALLAQASEPVWHVLHKPSQQTLCGQPRDEVKPVQGRPCPECASAMYDVFGDLLDELAAYQARIETVREEVVAIERSTSPGYNCSCQAGGVDAMSIDTDWLRLTARRARTALEGRPVTPVAGRSSLGQLVADNPAEVMAKLHEAGVLRRVRDGNHEVYYAFVEAPVGEAGPSTSD